MIEFHCARCGKKLKVKDEAAGKRGKCPQCAATLDVPQLDPVIPVADTPIMPQPPAPVAAVTPVPQRAFVARSGREIPCGTCGVGAMLRRKKYRMSGAVVFIGYILLIPSVIGILIATLMLFASGGATTATLDAMKTETKTKLARAGVSAAISDRVLAFETISQAELSRLPEQQRAAVESAQLSLSAGSVGAGAGGVLAGGASVCFGISAFVGGLLGWLLVMKKRVLQCNSCGAVVAAS